MNTLLAVITAQSLGMLFVWLVIAALIYFVLNWALAQIAPPQPFAKILQTVLVLVVAVLIVNALLGLMGHAFIVF
jgi:uncharacterized membrane protein